MDSLFSALKRARSIPKRVVIRLLGVSGRWLFAVAGDPSRTLPIARFLARTWVFGPLVEAAYHVMLFNNGYRGRTAEWRAWCFERCPESFYRGLKAAEAALYIHDFDRARDDLTKLKAMIAQQPEHEQHLHRVLEIDAIITLETKELHLETEALTSGRFAMSQYFYERAWEAHTMLCVAKLKASLRVYLSSVYFAPNLVEHVVTELYRPNSLWEEVLWATERALEQIDAFVSRSSEQSVPHNMQPAMDRLNGLRMEAAIHARQQLVVDECRKKGWVVDPRFMFSEALYKMVNRDIEGAIDALQKFLATKGGHSKDRALAFGQLGILYEEQRKFDLARLHYSQAFRAAEVPFWLPAYLWRYICLLMAFNEWDEAIAVARQGYYKIWKGFVRLTRVPIRNRLKRKEFVPQKGALFLASRSIGDEIFRLAIFNELRSPTGKYAFVCDGRLLDLLSNSFPDIEFIHTSVVTGKRSVPEKRYLDDRDGVPNYINKARITREVLKKIKEYPDVALSEDVMYAFIAMKGRFRRKDRKPLLVPSDHFVKRARESLAALPKRKMNIGICWRSGVRDIERDRSYTKLIDWRDILTISDANFINLQYSWEEDELVDVANAYGVTVYNMPDVDLKDDLHDVAALCTCVDLVITPGTAVRELAGAVGAKTYSISSTPYLPDLYRIAEDGKTDLIHPTITHITAYECGDTERVLAEIGRLIRDQVSARAKVA